MKRKPVKELYVDAIDISARYYDWSKGYPEVWDYIEACKCEECGKVVIVQGEDRHRYVDDKTDCDGYILTEGPMMNYFYPLLRFDHVDPQEGARRIVNLPLCLIRMEDTEEYGLALTGGGMDLSWEICEAYMLLNYLPPITFCDLPSMAGKRLNSRNKWILAGCRRSASVTSTRAGFTKERIRNIRSSLVTSKKTG